jgi:hypothetical protein
MLPCYSATNMLHAIQMKYKKKDYTVIPGKWKASATRPEHFQNPAYFDHFRQKIDSIM